jgi:hypothetical protein
VEGGDRRPLRRLRTVRRYGLAASLQATGFVPAVIGYNPNQVQFANIAQQVIAQAPNLTILISYEEGPSLLGALVNAGLSATQTLGLDSFFTPRLAAVSGATDPNLIEGFTALGTTGDRAFLQRMIEEDSNGQIAYAAQAYDCAITLALAAELVESQKADTIVHAVQAVTAGGLTCSTYADCKSKQDAGDDIDYDGSGKLAIDARRRDLGAVHPGPIQGGVLVNVTNTDVDIADSSASSGLRVRRAQHQGPASIAVPRLLHRPDRRLGSLN